MNRRRNRPPVFLSLVILAWLLALTSLSAKTDQCAQIMPLGGMGDSEVIIDPEDGVTPLVIVNQGEGPEGWPILLYTLNPDATGQEGESLILADNYTGIGYINGPEFMWHPKHGLGVLYAGEGGVHANWRIGGQWGFDVHGQPFGGAPPPLPGTVAGNYPGTQEIGLATRREFVHSQPELNGIGGVTDLVLTNVPEIAAGHGVLVPGVALHPSKDGYFLGMAWLGGSDVALYEGRIDNDGGVEPGSWRRLTMFSKEFFRFQALAAGIHPVTGLLVVYALGREELLVMECDDLDGCRFVAIYDLLQGMVHLRVVAGDAGLYLHMVIRNGADAGSYISAYEVASQPFEWISEHGGGAELAWLPAVGSLALFHTDMGYLSRCLID